MDTIAHAEYLLSLVNEKGELVISDEFRYRISVTIVSGCKTATDHFKNGIKERVKVQ